MRDTRHTTAHHCLPFCVLPNSKRRPPPTAKIRLLLCTVLALAMAPVVGAQNRPRCSSTNGNFSCTVADWTLRSWPSSTNATMLRSVRINTGSVRLQHFLKTSLPKDDLIVSGIVKWSVGRDQLADGTRFRVTVSSDNSTVADYDVIIARTAPNSTKEDIEFRVEFEDVLVMGRKYRAKVISGENESRSPKTSIISRSPINDCSQAKGLAKFWAPTLDVKTREVSGDLDVNFILAPSKFCIDTYEIRLEMRKGPVITTELITVNPNDQIANFTFHDLPRDQEMILKVRAKGSRDGQCACSDCKCMDAMVDNFEIPSIKLKNVSHPIFTNKTVTVVHHEPENLITYLSFLLVLLLLAVLIATCCLVTRFKPNIKRRLHFNINILQHITKLNKKSEKILLVCGKAVGTEEKYIEKIANAMKNSMHQVRFERFEPIDVELNKMDWIRSATAEADKIVLLHTSSPPSRDFTVYNVVLTISIPWEKKMCHVKLSPAAINPVRSETEFILPRDEKLLEKAFHMQLDTVEEAIVIPPNEIALLLTSSENTVDSGVFCSAPSEEAPPLREFTIIEEGGTERTVSTSDSNDVDIYHNVSTSVDSGHNSTMESRPLLREPIAV